MSDCGEKNEIYAAYLSRIPDAIVSVLSRENQHEINEVDGLVLTGGEDISPELYGDWADETVHVNPERDGVEYRYIEAACARAIPILGICRGIQVLNVYFGGTLVLDLEKYHNRIHRAISDTEDRYHEINLSKESLLMTSVNRERGRVNSSHHQAADRIGSGLKVTARADDGTVEAIEAAAASPTRIVAVQWHPERMEYDNPFARGVLELYQSFLLERAAREDSIRNQNRQESHTENRSQESFNTQTRSINIERDI